MSVRIVVTEGQAEDALAKSINNLSNEPARAQAMQRFGERLKRIPNVWNAPTILWAAKQVASVGDFELPSFPEELAGIINRHFLVKNNLPGNQKDLASFKSFVDLKNTVDPLYQDKRKTLAFLDDVKKDLKLDSDQKLDSLQLMQYAIDNSKIYVGPKDAAQLASAGKIVVQPLNRLASQLWGRPQECDVDPAVWKNFAAWCTTQVVNANLWNSYAPRGNLIYAFDVPKLMAMPATGADVNAGLACFAYKGGDADEWFDLRDTPLRDDEMLKNMDEYTRKYYLEALEQNKKYQGLTAQEHPLYDVINAPVRSNQQEIKVDIELVTQSFRNLGNMSDDELRKFLVACGRVPHDFREIASTQTTGDIETIGRLASIYVNTSVGKSEATGKIATLMRRSATKIARDLGIDSDKGTGVLWELMLCSIPGKTITQKDVALLDAYGDQPAAPRIVQLLPEDVKSLLARKLSAIRRSSDPALKQTFEQLSEELQPDELLGFDKLVEMLT